jgi:acyl dehydratase
MDTPRGRRLSPGEYWFEDLAIGDHYATGGIVVTEAHVVGYAGLTGDLFDVHVDDQFAREQGFPGRIAHGLLGLALTDGLKTRCAVRLMAVAALQWTWSFRAPILVGDRLAARIEVRECRRTKRGDRGVAMLRFVVTKQDGTVVQDGDHVLLVRCRPAEQAP